MHRAGERPLRVGRSQQGIGRRSKDGSSTVACVLEENAVVSLDGLPHLVVVTRQGRLHGLGVRFPEPGGALYVAE